MPATATEHVQRFLKDKGLNKKIDVRESKEASIPMAYGVLHPTIILPAGFDTDKTTVFESVVLHEYMHLKYHHPLLQHIIVLILCVNWFNPLIWMIYHYMGKDMEISCDLHVLDQIGSSNRESYALSLLELASSKGKDMTFYNGFTKHLVKERIVAIMKYKKITVKAAVFSILLPVMVFWLFGTSDNYVFGDEIEAGELEVVIVETPELPNYMENTNSKQSMKKLWIILAIVIVVIIAVFIRYQSTRVTLVEMKDVSITLWQTEDGFHDRGYVISEGIYEDRREVVIREKDSFTMTILTYDLEGNLIDAEVYTPSEGSEQKSEWLNRTLGLI